MFERADRLGFDGVWFNEFHFSRHSLVYPSTLLLAADIFARTERIRVGTSVLLLALYHPLLLAEQVAQLDYQSGGRLDVGIGRGTTQATFTALEIDPEQSRDRFAGALDVMLRAWTEKATSSAGPLWTFSGVEVGPPPIQKPHPPLYVAGYTDETIQFAADRGLPLLFSLEPPEGRQIAPFLQRLAVRGNMAPLRRSSLSRHVVVAATPAKAAELVDMLLLRVNERRTKLDVAGGKAPREPITRERLLATQAIAGDPAQCLAQLDALMRATGVEALRCYLNGNGVLPNEVALTGMDLFGREVLPAARQLTLGA